MIFDGTNYTDFDVHMRVHMRSLYLWGVLCGEVSCPPRPIAPMVPIPPTPRLLLLMTDRTATKTVDDVAVNAYDQQVADFCATLFAYRDAQSTQWCDKDARATAVLTASVLPFASEFMGLVLFMRCGFTIVNGIKSLVTLSTCLWSVKSMLSSRVIPVLMSSTHRVQLFGVSLTPSALRFVVLAPIAGL
jgi:hypothetical protein